MDDLLAGYGSDSEESSSSADNTTLNCKGNQETEATLISNLLGDGVDTCASSSGDDENTEQNRRESYPSNCSSDNEQAKKKQRLRKNDLCNKTYQEKKNSFLARHSLPPPRRASVLQPASMISWTTDYVSQEPRLLSVPHSADHRKFQRFEKLAASKTHHSEKGWAAHLRNQNDFHNPHFIQSVIEHCGINESLGSQAAGRATTRKRRFH